MQYWGMTLRRSTKLQLKSVIKRSLSQLGFKKQCIKLPLMFPLEIKCQNLYARNILEMYPEFEIVQHNKQSNNFNY